MRYSGHVHGRESDYFDTEVGTGSREAYVMEKRGKVAHIVQEVTESVGVRGEDGEDAIRWRQTIRRVSAEKEAAERKRSACGQCPNNLTFRISLSDGFDNIDICTQSTCYGMMHGTRHQFAAARE